jgi:hypothetical protein
MVEVGRGLVELLVELREHRDVLTGHMTHHIGMAAILRDEFTSGARFRVLSAS